MTTENSSAAQAAMAILIQALKVVSQRTVIALAQLFDLALCGSVFYLFAQLPASTSTLPLVSCALYSLFVLCVLFARRRG